MKRASAEVREKLSVFLFAQKYQIPKDRKRRKIQKIKM